MKSLHIFSLLILSYIIMSLEFQALGQNLNFPQPMKINNEMTVQQLTGKVYMVTHYFPWGGNSLFMKIDEDNGIMIDTPYDGVSTQALLDWIAKEFGKLQISAINTGFHQDNLGGNDILIKNRIPVYGMELTAHLVNTQSEKLKNNIVESVSNNENKLYLERYLKLILVPPNQVFKLKPGKIKMLKIAGEKFEFYFPGESHTIDNTIVYIPSEKVLFGGCMIRSLKSQSPGNIVYANMMEWPISVEKVIEKYPTPEIVIPGHGEAGNKSLLTYTLKLLKDWNKEHIAEQK